jgi:photosystem II stability/assembly factor-like uncharacterized protein
MHSGKSMWRRVLVGIALAIVISALPGASQTLDPAQWKGLRWRLIGPSRGGRALAVAGVQGNSNIFYFGAVAGGVWKTVNGGDSWAPLTDSTDIRSIGAIAVAPSDPNVIYVGTGEACIRGDISYGNGVYKSVDAGKTWTHLGLEDTRHIGRIAVDPNNADVVLVAALGHAFGPNQERGIYRSTDGGKNWTKVLFKDDQTGAIDVVFDPKNPRIAFGTLWQVNRKPWRMDSGGPGSGIYKSTDNGSTWRQVSGHGLPTTVMGRVGISVSGADDNRVYAAVEAERGGVYRSDDGGDSWRMMNADHELTQRAWYYMHIFADPNNADTLYVLNTSILKSEDGGRTFNAMRAPHGDNHGLWIDPTNSNSIINSNDGGATVTHDGGKSWTTQDNQPTAEFYHVDTDTRFPYWVYGAQQDNSTVAISSRPRGGRGGSGDNFYDVGGGESGWVVPDPKNPMITFAGSYDGLLTEYNHDTGISRDINAWPLNPMGAGAANIVHRFQWTFPIAVSPHDPNTWYIGGEVVFKSTDRGTTWTPISKDLTRNDKAKQASSGGPITQDNTSVEYYDTVFCIAESPVMKGEIWAGTDDGKVHLTRDGGQTWTDVTPKGIPEWIKVSIVDPSPVEDGTAYIALDAQKLDGVTPYLYRTSDFGKSWTKIVNGIPEGAFTHSIKADTKKKGLLFVGTEFGVYISFDDGARWQSLRLNMPNTPVHDLKIAGDDLVIATHGRAFWSLDDITPLRQMQAAMDDNHLFTPATGYHVRSFGGGGGVTVDYWLKSAPQAPISIEISDSQGKLIHRYQSARAGAEGEGAEGEAGGGGGGGRRGGGGGAPVPSANAGFNRFTWNMIGDAPAQVPNAVYWGGRASGVMNVPGKYHVKLTVDGKSYESDAEVQRDPRLNVLQEDLQKQFDFATQINERVDVGHKTINDIRALRTQIQEMKQRLGNDPKYKPVFDAADALDKKMTDVEEALIQTKSKAGEDALNFPIKIMNQLVDLEGVVESADAVPTAQSYQVYDFLNKQLDEELAKWKDVQANELAALNNAMKQADVPGVSIPPARAAGGGRGGRRGGN